MKEELPQLEKILKPGFSLREKSAYWKTQEETVRILREIVEGREAVAKRVTYETMGRCENGRVRTGVY